MHDLKLKPLTGLWVASAIIILWIGSLALLCHVDAMQLAPLWIVAGVWGRTFIQTGLFIVAHDAIHGTVVPSDRQLNDWIGRFTVSLYALLSYDQLAVNHHQHHKYPGSARDPDFHDGINSNIFAWYLKFMKEYFEVGQFLIQLLGLGAFFIFLYFGCHISLINLFFWWVLPIFLSTVQLFFFGTYLPHRAAIATPLDASQPQPINSSNYPLFWSFLTCYHFGYHWEHHQYPFSPWYNLPSYHLKHKLSKIEA